MNEAETRAELIDPKCKENGWDGKANSDIKVHREYIISPGKLKASGGRNKPVIADYVLSFKGRKVAVMEAKSDTQEVGEGVNTSGGALPYFYKAVFVRSFAIIFKNSSR